MNANEQKPDDNTSRWWYLVLATLSAIVPCIHFQVLNNALEKTRYEFDGRVGLLPGFSFFLKGFGAFACLIVIALLLLFIASWFYKSLAKGSTVATVSGLCCAFWVFYAIWCDICLTIFLGQLN